MLIEDNTSVFAEHTHREYRDYTDYSREDIKSQI